MFHISADLPVFVKGELEKLEGKIAPMMKKAAKYALFSYPMIFISLINLFILIFFVSEPHNSAVSIVIYAAIGAIGMALGREGKLLRKDVAEKMMNYIIERMTKSETVADEVKNRYIFFVREQPARMLAHFIDFLKEERRMEFQYDAD